ncbi:uncharacterized protein ACIQIH_002169 isoform 1-T1 [Cyanocitta cristata]
MQGITGWFGLEEPPRSFTLCLLSDSTAKNIQNCHLPLTDSRNVLHSSCFGMGTAVGSSGRSSTQRQQRESWRRRWKTLSLGWWNSWEMESSRSSKNRVGSRLQPAKNIQNCHLPLTDSRNVLHSSCFGMGTAVGSSGRSSTQRQQRESWRRRWKTLSLGWWNSWEMESSRSSKNRVGSRLQPAKNIQNCHLPLTDSRNVLHSSCFGMGMAVGSSGRTSGETFKQEVLKRTGASAR